MEIIGITVLSSTSINVTLGVDLFSYQDPVSVEQLEIPTAVIVAIKNKSVPCGPLVMQQSKIRSHYHPPGDE